LPNFIKIGQTVEEIWRFNGFKNGGRPPSWILGNQIFQRSGWLRDPFCIIVPHFAKIGQSVAIFVILQNGCRRNLGF